MTLKQLERITKVPLRRIVRYSRLGFIGEQIGETIELSEADIYPLKIIYLIEQANLSVRKIIDVIDAKNRGDTANLQNLYHELISLAETPKSAGSSKEESKHLKQLAAELSAFIKTP